MTFTRPSRKYEVRIGTSGTNEVKIKDFTNRDMHSTQEWVTDMLARIAVYLLAASNVLRSVRQDWTPRLPPD